MGGKMTFNEIGRGKRVAVKEKQDLATCTSCASI
jgi:glycerol-3-phosphate dehydrogenase